MRSTVNTMQLALKSKSSSLADEVESDEILHTQHTIPPSLSFLTDAKIRKITSRQEKEIYNNYNN